MADLEFLPNPHDCLVEAEPSLETNGEQVQAVRQTQLQPVPPAIGCVGKPEIRDKETNHDCQDEKKKYVTAEIHGRTKPQNCWNRQPHAQKNIGMMRLAITGEH